MNQLDKCAACNNTLPRREYLACVACKLKYDLECLSISSKLFNIMERKDAWKCPKCLSKGPKKCNINTPVHNNSCRAEKNSSAIQRHSEIDNNVTQRTKVRRASPSPEEIQPSHLGQPTGVLIEDLKLYMSDLIKSQMESLKETIHKLTETITSQNIRIESLESRVLVLEGELADARSRDVSDLENTITQLQADLSDRDQALLINDVEISGCPETANESCVHLVLAIAHKTGIVLDEKDVVSAQRVGQRVESTETSVARPRPLAVRLARREPRDALLRAARVRRTLNTEGLHLDGPTRPLFINERLTKLNRVVFQKARLLARKHKFRFVWTRDGKIFIRKEQGAGRQRLRSEADLKRVFGDTDV